MSRRWTALGLLTVAVLLIGVDGTVLALATPFIGNDLGSNATGMLWVADIYSFVLAGLLVTMGSLGDRVGHKKLLLWGVVGFGAMSLATAYAPSVGLLIGARALLGVAGATLAPSTLALIRGLFSQPRQRTVAIGIWAAGFSAGSALGPVIGGLLLDHFWWGSVFLINVPVAVVLVVGGIALLPELPNPNPGPWDLPSAALSLVGVLGLVYAVKEGAAGGFGAATVIAGMAGVVALALFVRRQLRLTTPLIDLRLFRNTVFSVVVISNLFVVLGLSGVVFFLSQFFQLVDGYPPIRAGLAELPAAVAAMTFGVLAVAAVRVWSRRAVLATGLALVGTGLASLTAVDRSTAYPQLAITLFVVGAGLGLAYTVANDIILASVAPQRAGAAAAISETAYELGMALGIAVLGSIVACVYRGLAIPPGIDGAAARQARETLGGAHQVAASLPAPQAHDLLAASANAFTDGLAAAAAVGSVLLLVSAAAVWLLLKPRQPDRVSPCSKLNTLSGSYVALIVRKRSTLGPQ